MDNQVNIEQLQEAENSGTEYGSTEKEPAAPEDKAEPVADAGVESADSQGATVVADGQANPADDAGKSTDTKAPEYPWLAETPYKEPTELVKGYKNLQSEYNKTQERYKPYSTLVERIENDFRLRTFLDQALQGYDNPALMEAYQGGVAEPNAQNYDLVDPEQQVKYRNDLKAWTERTIDQRINARTADLDANAKLEAAKNKFRADHPGLDPDEVLKYARSKREYSLEDFHRLMIFDTVKSDAMAEARKELTKQLEVAQKSKTPTASATAKNDVRAADILADIASHGSAYAVKKYTEGKVARALQETM